MKAIIMAAGKGTRMLPLTENIPKVLLEINGKPFIYYVLENLIKAGFTEFGIVAGYMKEKIAEFIKEFGYNATIIEQKEQLGTGHAVMQAKDFVGEDNFIVLGGDNIFSVEDLKAVNNDDDFCYVVGKKDQHPEKYGVLVLNDNDDNDNNDNNNIKKLIKIVEKTTKFVNDLINIGLYKFTPEIWPALDEISLSERNEYELTDAVNILAADDKVRVFQLKDYWIDLGCKEDLVKVEKFVRENF